MQSKSNTIKETLHLLSNEKASQRLVDVLYILKEESNTPKITKNIAYMSTNTQSDFDPQVNLKINEILIPRGVLDFRSQVNIPTKSTWEKLGRPQFVKSYYYLKLTDQGLIEPLGLCRNIHITIMRISIKIDFKVIEPKEGSKSYLALGSQPSARKMRANISLEKDIIKLKGQGKKIITPLDPKEGAPWEEPNDSKDKVIQLYKIIQSNLDFVEPNDQGELDIESPTFVG